MDKTEKTDPSYSEHMSLKLYNKTHTLWFKSISFILVLTFISWSVGWADVVPKDWEKQQQAESPLEKFKETQEAQERLILQKQDLEDNRQQAASQETPQTQQTQETQTEQVAPKEEETPVPQLSTEVEKAITEAKPEEKELLQKYNPAVLTPQGLDALKAYLASQKDNVINCASYALGTMLGFTADFKTAVSAIMTDIFYGIITPKTQGTLMTSLFALKETVLKLKDTVLYALKVSIETLKDIAAPVIAHIRDAHYVVVTKVTDTVVTFTDNTGKFFRETIPDFLNKWKGIILSKEKPEEAIELTEEESKTVLGADPNVYTDANGNTYNYKYNEAGEYIGMRVLYTDGTAEDYDAEDNLLKRAPYVKAGDDVAVTYTGRLTDGYVFDSNENSDEFLEFTVGGGQLIEGFDKAVRGLMLGEKITVTIPPEEAYGLSGESAHYLAGETLIFDITIKKLNGQSYEEDIETKLDKTAEKTTGKDGVVKAAKEDLAELLDILSPDLAELFGLAADSYITVKSVEEVTWEDSSLGWRTDEKALAGPVEGYKITLGYNGRNYAYHTRAQADENLRYDIRLNPKIKENIKREKESLAKAEPEKDVKRQRASGGRAPLRNFLHTLFGRKDIDENRNGILDYLENSLLWHLVDKIDILITSVMTSLPWYKQAEDERETRQNGPSVSGGSGADGITEEKQPEAAKEITGGALTDEEIEGAENKIKEHQDNIAEIQGRNNTAQEVKGQFEALLSQLPEGYLYQNLGFEEVVLDAPIEEAIRKSQEKIALLTKGIEDSDSEILAQNIDADVTEFEESLSKLAAFIETYTERIEKVKAEINAINNNILADEEASTQLLIDEITQKTAALQTIEAQISAEYNNFMSMARLSEDETMVSIVDEAGNVIFEIDDAALVYYVKLIPGLIGVLPEPERPEGVMDLELPSPYIEGIFSATGAANLNDMTLGELEAELARVNNILNAQDGSNLQKAKDGIARLNDLILQKAVVGESEKILEEIPASTEEEKTAQAVRVFIDNILDNAGFIYTKIRERMEAAYSLLGLSSTDALNMIKASIADGANSLINCAAYVLTDLLGSVDKAKVAVSTIMLDVINGIFNDGVPNILMTSLFALKKIGETISGAYLYALGVSLDQLRDIAAPFIAYMKEAHYVIITELTDDLVTYTDNTGEFFQETLPDFLNKWKGIVLSKIKPEGAVELREEETKKILGAGVNTLPVITAIPNQTIITGENFTSINLNDYVSDVESPDTAITWSYSG
ncbi:MAG: FKBP-type peptidyl-prolyl cis-trans isomerase, partial [Candidatus Omnitrophica bacterium]|nr:FKBP-type peptidyl-prolyl cis-trans isomerase [Candidatus Omnitrophota bacterium]